MQIARFEDAASGALATHNVTYQEAGARFTAARPAPASLAGPVPPEFRRWYDEERGPPGAGLLTLDHVAVFGDRTYRLRDGRLLEVPQNGVHRALIEPEWARFQAMQREGGLRVRHFDDELVVLSGEPYRLYGHWLVDFLPRLQVLRSLGRDPARCRYLVPSDLPRFARQWLAALGIPESGLVWFDPATDLCRCRRLLMPTNLRDSGRALPLMRDAAAYLGAALLGSAPRPEPGRRLYLSREGWGNVTRRLENAAEMEAVAAEYGFDVARPERLTIGGQARLFAGADIVVGDYGSALHNAIFSPPGTRVVALRGTAHHPGFLQSGLCEIRDQPMSYVFGRTWSGEHGHQHYAVSPDDLRRCLDHVLAGDPPDRAHRLHASARPPDPDDLDPFASLETATAWAWTAYHAADWPESHRRWEGVRAAWPTYAPAFVHAATSLSQAGRKEAACALLQQGRALLPDDAQLLTTLAGVLAETGRPDQARTLVRSEAARFADHPEVAAELLRLEQVVDPAPPQPPPPEPQAPLDLDEAILRTSLEAATAWAWIPYHAGDWPDSCQRWARVQAAWPDYPPAQVHLATSLARSGRTDEADRLLAQARARHPADAELLTTHAKLLDAIGRLPESLSLLSGRIADFPDNPEVAIDFLRIAHDRVQPDAILASEQVVERTHPGLIGRDQGVRHFFDTARRQGVPGA